MDFDTALYVVYIACMAGGALLFASWARNPKGVPVWEYIVATAIPVWSGLAYLAMAFDYGTVEIAGQTTYWARYADWVVTTPLLLVALWMTATTRADKSKHVPTLVTIVVADIVMILSGLIADLSVGTPRLVYYGIGVAALVVIFVVVWGPLRRVAQAQGDEVGKTYTTVAGYLALFWIGYPLTWALGPSGLGVVGQGVDTALFVLLPIFSKVGFSILDLSLLRKMDHVEEPQLQVQPAL
ncbi:bacteriorhodopsin [Rubrivirga sp.]|uniref:bacteriorhodopsin n=1 Tax=Rubrivirga sp. TaxID=1885344 RepID=UPI003C7142D6